MKKSKKIRVGLIRCDTHGMWYGAQMADHDGLLLRQPMPISRQTPMTGQFRYSWQPGGVHYFFYSHYSHPWRMTAPRVAEFEIVKIWDEDRRSAEMFSKVFYGKPQVCKTFAEVSDNVDLVFIADCNGDGSDHLKLARPGLKKGVATFIDKPMANSMKNVKAIKALAKRYRAPVMSLSILQTNPATARIKRSLDEVGKVSFGAVTGHSTRGANLIHSISIVHHVFGTGIKTVTCRKARNHTTVHLDYGEREDRPEHGVTLHCGVAAFRFTEMFVTAYGPEGAIQKKALDDFDASEGSARILQHICQMVRTGKPHPLAEEMVEAVAVAEAIWKAEKSGKAVLVRR